MADRNAGILVAVIEAIDWLDERVGRATAWLVLAMVLNTFLVAVLRYGFDFGRIWLQELYVWMHGTIIMVAVGYTLLHDGHVRVDVIYRSAGPRAKAWIDLIGFLLFLLPTVAVVTWAAWPYVLLSWHRLEISREAGGMPGLFLWKSTMLAFCLLLFLQGVALALRSLVVLLGGSAPPGEHKSEEAGV